MGVPSLPIRNFSKFQAISVLLTGFQIKKWGLQKDGYILVLDKIHYLAIRLSESSEGAGSDFLRKVKSGCSFSPFTSTCSHLNQFWQLARPTSLESLFKLVLKLKVLICWKQMKTGHLVKHFSLKLEAIAWSDVLQEVDDLLPASVLLRKYSSSWLQVSCSSSTSWLSTYITIYQPPD